MHFRRARHALAVGALILVASLGCVPDSEPGQTGTGGAGGSMMGGTGGATCIPNGGTTTPPATFATVKEALRGMGAVESCASNPCHAKGGMVPFTRPLVLQEDADLYKNMTAYVSAACGEMKLINPGKPAESALVKIISGPCGAVSRMPRLCTDDQCLPPEYIAAISQWIANCAPQ